jgi:murein DD-endopeptidase
MSILTKNPLSIVLLSLIVAIFVGCINSPTSQNKTNASATSRFGIPIDCTLGKNCFIMHYVDRDPSSQVVDFGCGRQTYDGHTGVDFAISNWQKMTKGVPVIAAASGKVLRVRDGVADRLVSQPSDKQAVTNTECGNGLVIEHGDGWETQYCHLRQGSLAVKPGMQVEKGTVLGMVGASGLASFPHVHLTVRYQGQTIDPFVGVSTADGCQVKRDPLWEQPLAYVPTGLIEAGFADRPPKEKELWQGDFVANKLSNRIEALIFWVHAYGVKQGDKERFWLTAPDGSTVIKQENSLEKPYRSWVSYVGKRNSEQSPFAAGLWRGKYQLWRGEGLIFEVDRELEVS